MINLCQTAIGILKVYYEHRSNKANRSDGVKNTHMVVIYEYYFLFLQLNSNILPCMNDAGYIISQRYNATFSEMHKRVQVCCAEESRENGRENPM